MNNAEHPIWALARQVAVLVSCLVTFQIAYYNKLSTSDIIPIVTILLSVAGVDATKRIIQSRQ